MNAKSLTINKMFYFSSMINIKECDELLTDTFAIKYKHTNLTTDLAPSERIQTEK